MRGVLARAEHGHLVGAPGAFDLQPVDLARPRPALRAPQHQHGPAGARGAVPAAGRPLERANLVERLVERRREALVSVCGRLVELARHEERPPPVALEECDELVLRDAGEHGRVRDLVAVQVQDREHGSVGGRVQELVRVPARRERPSLRFAVADDARDEEVGVVEGGAEGVGQGVSELAALVDRARRLGRDVRGDPARERELAKERAQPVLADGDVRVELGVRAFEIGVRDEPRPAVARPRDVDRRQVAGA